MTAQRFYVIERDDEQWVPFFRWFWYEVDGSGRTIPSGNPENPYNRHGAYPARCLAARSARSTTGGREWKSV